MHQNANVAQSVVQLIRNQQVAGSIPVIGSNNESIRTFIKQIDTKIIQKWMIFLLPKISSKIKMAF